MNVDLTEEQRQALQEGEGVVQGEGWVLLSGDAYREMAGVGTDEELRAALEAFREGLADVNAGRTRPFREVLAELGRNDEASA